jgi:DDE domain
VEAISYKRHRFPTEVIGHAVWLYFRFTLSFRDVEDLLAERGIDVSYETIRCWTLKFGRLFARNLRRSRPRPTGRWHLDEMVVKIGGQRMYLWRAVDDEGEVLDMLVQKRRNKPAALKLLRKLLRNQGVLAVIGPSVLAPNFVREPCTPSARGMSWRSSMASDLRSASSSRSTFRLSTFSVKTTVMIAAINATSPAIRVCQWSTRSTRVV